MIEYKDKTINPRHDRMESRSLRLVTVNGSYGSPSKTELLLDVIHEEISKYRPTTLHKIEVCELGPGFTNAFFRSQVSEEVDRQMRILESADVIIAGSPVYQASYSGLFKHFFDMIDPTTLVNKPALLCAVGGSVRHALMIDHMLRPLFSYFKALIAPTAIYACTSDFTDMMIGSEELQSRIESAVKTFEPFLPRPAGACEAVHRHVCPLKRAKAQ